MKFWMLIFAAVFLPLHAFADEHQFANGEAVAIQPDEAYVLVRSFNLPGGALRGATKFTPVLIRALSDDELKQANALAEKDPDSWTDKVESNVVEPLADQPYAEENGEEFLLMSLKPGSYVVGGAAVTNWATQSAGGMVTSLCMGTVKFDAKPGVVTDLGAILVARDDEPTAIPELSKVVSGKPMGFGPVPQIMAIRPATSAMEIPETLKVLPLAQADYRAVGAFPNYIGARISRLAPIAGVLDYDKDGHVIDLRAGGGTGP